MRSTKLTAKATQAAANRLIERALVHAGVVVATVAGATTKAQQRALADSITRCNTSGDDWRCLDEIGKIAHDAGAGDHFDEMCRLAQLADRLA